MNSKGGKNKGLLGLFISVQAVLIILKVLGEISVSWWLVLIPFWAWLLIVGVCLIAMGILAMELVYFIRYSTSVELNELWQSMMELRETKGE
ncbi:hypothetical protein [Tetragenococcus halophilus]|uniref:Uncharacterized protein n=1 Tax=Tetragenococcus halophilus TaxID=51669 RepID=A0AB35HQZ1_TETHA|nr:hypothetical protein [Tetragenococcus halophilus]MCO8298651.1 hypothetical protein [Tetragenococcus halophilus]